MNVDEEAKKQLADGFQAIAQQYQVPGDFPTEVLESADRAIADCDAHGEFLRFQGRRDVTHLPFVTLDPATSTDLDQAFAIDKEGANLVLSYALADVSPYVPMGGAIEQEAWKRGVTIYGLSQKTPLYPRSISQGAASLLPDGPRPAVLVTIVMQPDGVASVRSVERVNCRSRAKLAYDSVDLHSIPYLEEFAKRSWEYEMQRGAIRVEFPQQEVIADASAPGGVRLVLRPRVYSEEVNSALSLAVNMAIGTMFKESGVGLFRVMSEPDPRAVERLRRTAHALGIPWTESETLRDLQKRLDTQNVTHQRFMLDARRAGGRAGYAVYQSGVVPWHSAIAATYAHATAPMRRLADRYVLDLAVLIANERAIPPTLLDQLTRLPKVMEQGEGRAANVDRAVIDLLEAISVQHRIGEILDAEVVDAESGIVQTFDSAIRSRATLLHDAPNGTKIKVRIDGADPASRKVRLTAVT